MAHLAVVAATLVAVGVSVLLQYEGLVLTWKWISGHRGIWVFGTAIWLLLLFPATGSLNGPETVDFFECVYLSAVTFSTVGFGDIAPVGAIRFLSGTEALTGFVLITWSASFTYLEMERFWRAEEMDSRKDE
jgi:hypothetical protein